ncbi:MAG: hypothetical protein ABI134_02265 [Byssovorax sp.]
MSTTDKAFQYIVGQTNTNQLVRTWLLPRLVFFFTGFSAARHEIFNTISQVRINYHGSALSEGEAGEVQGGDRLPWVPSAEGDNFTPLRSLGWLATPHLW